MYRLRGHLITTKSEQAGALLAVVSLKVRGGVVVVDGAGTRMYRPALDAIPLCRFVACDVDDPQQYEAWEGPRVVGATPTGAREGA
jgi:hypothetical protein